MTINECWEDQIFRHSKYLGGGGYSQVYACKHSSNWVIKKGNDDGTRTYLEWVQWRQKNGKALKGMPELDFLIPHEELEGFYVAGMKRYSPIKREYLHSFGWGPEIQGTPTRLHERKGCPKYLKNLAETFENETGVRANDIHFGNVMYDKGKNELVLTDPSSMTYHKLDSQMKERFPLPPLLEGLEKGQKVFTLFEVKKAHLKGTTDPSF